MRSIRLIAILAVTSLPAATALAQGQPQSQNAPVTMVSPGHWGGPFGMWYGGWQPEMVVNVPSAVPTSGPATWQGRSQDLAGLDREGWLRECRRRLGDNGVGGAVIGGVVGGVAGNALAGHGNRTVGTVAGAVVGAVAGAAIDKAEDRARVQDRCEAMLAAPPAAYGYAYGVPMMLVPVALVPLAQAAGAQPAGPQSTTSRPCKETVVTEEFYEPVPRRARHIPRRRAPDKRIPQ